MTAWEEELELIAQDRTVFQEEDGRREQIVYQKFPECEDGWVESQLNAALAFGSCQFAVRMLHGPLKKMIDGMLNLLLDLFGSLLSGLLTYSKGFTTKPRKYASIPRDARSMSHAFGRPRTGLSRRSKMSASLSH